MLERRDNRAAVTDPGVDHRPGPALTVGPLDGATLFRFAHMWRNPNAGGMERYLTDLNARLLQRNRMRIVQMYLVNDKADLVVSAEQIGLGELVWIPSVLSEERPPSTRIERQLRKMWRRATGRPFVQHDLLLKELRGLPVSLAAFHWISEDSRVVLDDIVRRRLPYIVVNHFQNTRLTQRLMRDQIRGACAICGVSAVGVPEYLADRFFSVSDGIDTDFFQLGHARPLKNAFVKPLILLPSRVTPGKGHLEAVESLARLSLRGVSASLAFAGRIESEKLLRAALDIARREGIEDRVIVTGELGADALKSWYAASDVVLLTSHTEGLGRVLLEAQAMERAVIAYDVGGTREAVADGETGYLVPLRDVGVLTDRLAELLAQPDLRSQMGKRGRQRVIKAFSLDALAVRHERLYADILRTSPLSAL